MGLTSTTAWDIRFIYQLEESVWSRNIVLLDKEMLRCEIALRQEIMISIHWSGNRKNINSNDTFSSGGIVKKLKIVTAASMLAFALANPGISYGASNLIDHRLPRVTSGFWHYYDIAPYGMAVVTIGGALWEGPESRLGKTFWQSADALVVTGAFTEILKQTMRREFPVNTDDPNKWFDGGHAHSFPSGHTSTTTAMVTPIILEYKDDHPAVWALAALPVYAGVGAIKDQAHWQTDVLAGAFLGYAVGWAMHKRQSPFLVSLLPGGAFVGYKKRLP